MSVVGTSNETVYEKLVKPDYPIVDYNTKCVYIIFIYIVCRCLFGTNIKINVYASMTHVHIQSYM